MASEKLRRRAGASGVGSASAEPESETQKTDESPETKADKVQKILAPELLRIDITRKVNDADSGTTLDKPFVLVVPTEFTIGQIVLKNAAEDFDAYIRLVLVELQTVCPSPLLAFSSQNMGYLPVVLLASNVRAFMNRVVSKSAYVLDPDDADEKKLAVRLTDLELSDEQTTLIGASYVNRWITKRTEALEAQKAAAELKNAARAAQT